MNNGKPVAVPRGNTCRKVNELIDRMVRQRGWELNGAEILDLACGRGEFLQYLSQKFPKATIRGVDRESSKTASGITIVGANLEKPFRVFPDILFDFLICISGVMEFDNTLQFFSCCRQHLKPGGYFLVTNDNLLSVRDRLSLLFCGKPRQYPLHSPPGQATWKILPIQNMLRLLLEAGLRVEDIQYIPVRPKDWLFLPLALLIFPFQEIFLRLSKRPVPQPWRGWMYPFSSLLSRHYVILCQNPSEERR